MSEKRLNASQFRLITTITHTHTHTLIPTQKAASKTAHFSFPSVEIDKHQFQRNALKRRLND